VAGMQTQKAQAELAVDVMKKTIGDFIADGPTDEELQAAKNNLVNGFPLRIDSNRKILDNVSSIAWNDLPLDTLDQWTNQLRQVTKDQVTAAFKKNLISIFIVHFVDRSRDWTKDFHLWCIVWYRYR
jgi:zinc protease